MEDQAISIIGRLFGGKQATGPVGPSVYLGVFGKHPGWNDHIDDIGLETERLVSVKSLVYLSGIGSRIDSGAWDALAEGERLAEFDHLILMRWAGEVVLARVWSSTDGKGRSKYPMIAAVHAIGAGLEWVLSNVPGELEQLRERCRAVSDAAEVIKAAETSRSTLRGKLPSGSAGGNGAEVAEAVIPAGTLSAIAGHPECQPDGQGLLRVLYQLESEGAAYLNDAGRGVAPAQTRSLAMRVPRCADSAVQGLERWAHALLTRVQPGAPMLLAAPVQRSWVDVVLGEPTGAELFCLRAGLGSIPLASEVPYTMDDAFVQRTRGRIASAASQGDVRVVVETSGAGGKKGARGSGRVGGRIGGWGAGLVLLSAGCWLGAPASVRAAVEAGAQGGGAVEPEVIEPREQFNRAVTALRESVRGASDDRVIAAVRSFQSTVKAIPGGVWYLAPVSELSDKLDRAISGEGAPAPMENLSELGPASTGVYRAVTLAPGRVRFEPIAPSSQAMAIEFVRVEGGGAGQGAGGVDRPFYLAKTELSVGQAIGIIRAQRLEEAWRELSPPVDPRDDAREGLRTWEWGFSPSPVPRVSSSWLGATALTLGAPLYAVAGGAPKPPSSSSPMQQIAPAEALLLVSALGCRLPSVAEWTAASASAGVDGPSNVRDQTWRRHQQYVEEQASRGKYLPSGDLGSFDAGAATSSGSAADVDDGVLWLAEVDKPLGDGPGPSFVHLFGNVLEYVVDGAPVEDRVAGRAGASRDAAAALGDRLRVVGGSALTPVSVDPKLPRPIAPEKLHMGYADVGLRPAFTAPGPGRARSMAERIERVLDPLPMLPRR